MVDCSFVRKVMVEKSYDKSSDKLDRMNVIRAAEIVTRSSVYLLWESRK